MTEPSQPERPWLVEQRTRARRYRSVTERWVNRAPHVKGVNRGGPLTRRLGHAILEGCFWLRGLRLGGFEVEFPDRSDRGDVTFFKLVLAADYGQFA